MRTKYEYRISTRLLEPEEGINLEHFDSQAWVENIDDALQTLIGKSERELGNTEEYEIVSHDIAPIGDKLLFSILFRIFTSPKRVR